MIQVFGKFSFPALFLCILQMAAFGQPSGSTPARSQEISDDDGLPVLVKHLPDWEKERREFAFINGKEGLKTAFDGKKVLHLIDFAGGTEAVAASYPAGRLLIVEFTSPQGSADADARITGHLAAEPEAGTVYRRVGNYNVFVFDAPSPETAAALIDQVSYGKTVQWLGEDPYLLKRLERYFVTTTRDIFISTVMWIVGGIGISIVCGIIAGIVFYRIREQKRAQWARFSDAGGLVRLNLDELSE